MEAQRGRAPRTMHRVRLEFIRKAFQKGAYTLDPGLIPGTATNNPGALANLLGLSEYQFLHL